jgi:glycosyltransferase involved in cell wall biosynthesis
VHQLNHNTLEVPGFGWMLGLPFVWGPVGGGQVPSPKLKSYFGRTWAYETFRALRKRFVHLNPVTRAAARRAAYVMFVNLDTGNLLRPLVRGRLLHERESAVVLPNEVVERPAGSPFTISWYSRFAPRKGMLLALDIAAELRSRGVQFRLVMGGDGEWRPLTAKRIEAMGLGDCVELAPYISYEGMGRFYDESDVFLFTSLHDSSGDVVLEAMSKQRPIVCLNQHGAAEMVSSESGIKVAIESKEQVVSDMATALQRLAEEPDLRREMGRAARQRVAEHFVWERKAAVLRHVYQTAIRDAQHARRSASASRAIARP